MHGINMHWLDIVVFSVIGCGAVMGLLSGFVRQAVRLLSLLGAFYAAIHCHAEVAHAFSDLLEGLVPGLRRPAAFGIAFVGCYLAIWIAIWLMKAAWNTMVPPQQRPNLGLGWMNRLLGAGLGAVFACVLLGPAILVMESIQEPRFHARLEGSRCRPHFLKGMETVSNAIPQSFKDEFLLAVEELRQHGLEALGELSTRGTQEATVLLKSFSTK